MVTSRREITPLAFGIAEEFRVLGWALRVQGLLPVRDTAGSGQAAARMVLVLGGTRHYSSGIGDSAPRAADDR